MYFEIQPSLRKVAVDGNVYLVLSFEPVLFSMTSVTLKNDDCDSLQSSKCMETTITSFFTWNNDT